MTAIQQPLFNPDLQYYPFPLSDNQVMEILFDSQNGTFWLNQKQMSILFDIDESRVTHHIRTLKDEWATYAQSAGVEILKIKMSQQEGARIVQRDIEHYNHDTVIDVGYRARSNERTFWFRRSVNDIVNQHIQDKQAKAIQKIKHQRAVEITSYIRSGMTQSHAEKRVDMKSTFKQLTAIILEISDSKMIGTIVSKEYLLLFGKLADELKTILKAKNVRDALPELQLDYLDLTEKSLIAVLPHCAHMKREQIIELVEKTVKPLAEHLKMICELSGVNVLTGRKMIGGGK